MFNAARLSLLLPLALLLGACAQSGALVTARLADPDVTLIGPSGEPLAGPDGSLPLPADHSACVKSNGLAGPTDRKFANHPIAEQLHDGLDFGATPVRVEFADGSPPLHGALLICGVYAEVQDRRVRNRADVVIPPGYRSAARRGERVAVYEVYADAFNDMGQKFEYISWILWLSDSRSRLGL